MNRRSWRWVAWGSMVTAAGGLAFACGSSKSSTGTGDGGGFGDGGSRGDGTTGGHGDGGGKQGGDGSSLGNGDTGTLAHDSATGDVTMVALDAGCASSNAAATLVPAYLVFVMDRSDSMKQYGKWPACQAALESFFDDPSTTGISASLTFMPFFVEPDGGKPDSGKASCVSTDYQAPEVAMTALPSTAFKPVIQAETLALGTPTEPAVLGALEYAKTFRAAHPTDKVLIVLATDGYPAGCGGSNSVGGVADAAAYARKDNGVPVYVIGVGPATGNSGITNLNQIAEAGGTGSAFFIPTAVDGGDASITTTGFVAAVKTIQSELACRYSIPAAPAGQTLDYSKVNVVLTIAGKPTTLDYSQTCSNTDGWYYDESDAGVPQQIVLCSAACSQAMAAGTSSSASIVLGCDTQGGMPPK